ncbi:NAD(P)/FAD-dependent oxidoreductase [Paragemmobacter ruber]|uniref:FAD-dependent oxidoreductase n=1 Tax=Paragemmobacter ruber TaxID=1985673 RepID=A0ABW9YA91_9RHOB|nr:FAD-binding oxidoreductase [Rhodobacter ruber]NBE08660.1 FAD-dependent oxidoreductase [Rhodobacter ruber]
MQPHILILGAGITGAALAHQLAKGGATVTVVDAGSPAGAASGGSFGWVNASFFLSEAHFHLRHAAMEAHQALAAELGLDPQPQGCLWHEATGADFDHQHEALHRLGYPLRLLDRAEIARREPLIANPPDRALFFPTERAVDLAALTDRLLSAASARGARVILGLRGEALLTAQGRVIGLRMPQATIMADHVILATGTGTPALLVPLGLTLPMQHRPGAVLHSQPLPPLLTHILATPEQEVRQDRDGRLIAPAAAHHQSDASEDLPGPDALIRATLARLRAIFPQADIRPDRLILAQRPVPGDGLPAIGAVAPGLSVAVMHSGATLAPHVAALLAAEVLGQGESPALAPFRPSRLFT